MHGARSIHFLPTNAASILSFRIRSFSPLNVSENVAYGLHAANTPSPNSNALDWMRSRWSHAEFAAANHAPLWRPATTRRGSARGAHQSPELLLLDEPLSALHATFAKDESELKSLQREVGITFFSQQQTRRSHGASDRIALLPQWRPRTVASPRESTRVLPRPRCSSSGTQFVPQISRWNVDCGGSNFPVPRARHRNFYFALKQFPGRRFSADR